MDFVPVANVDKRILREPVSYMRLAGLWPEKRWLITEVFANHVFPKMFLLNMCMTLSYIWTDEEEDVVIILQSICDTLATFMCYSKLASLIKHGRKLLSLRQFLQRDFAPFEEVICEEAGAINNRFLKRAKSVCFWYLWIYAPITVLGVALNWTSAFTQTPEERRMTVNLPRFILGRDYLYWPVLVAISSIYYVFIFSSVGFDVMFVSLCLQIKCKAEILRANLRYISSSQIGYSMHCDLLKTKMKGEVPHENAAFDLEDRLRTVTTMDLPDALTSCVKYHNLIISLRDGTEAVFARTCLYQMFYILVSLGVPAVRLLKDDSMDAQIVAWVGFYAVWNFGQLLFFCWFGDLVADSSEQVADAAWEAYRHGMCGKSRVALQMMIMRAHKPLYLTADRFVYLTRRLYLDIMRRSQSLYSAILNMR